MSEIEACRTCGIFFLMTSNVLRHLLESDPEILAIRRELEAWNIKVDENDTFPQYICTVCLLEFRKIFNFQNACLQTQKDFCQLYTMQQDNLKNKIKTEPGELENEPVYKSVDIDEQNSNAFIYIDDLPDGECDDDNSNVPQFKVPTAPIKEEVIEEARVPLESTDKCNDDELRQSVEVSVFRTPLKVESQNCNESTVKETCEQSESKTDIQCELCLHVSMDQQEHRQHLLRIHEPKALECHICGKQFKAGTTQTRFKYHLKWHRLNKHIKCTQCGFHCASREVLNEHTRAVHIKTSCKICGKRVLPKKMRSHMERHQESKPAVQTGVELSDYSNDIEQGDEISISHSSVITENASLNESDTDSAQLNNEDSIMESGSENETSSLKTLSTTMSYSPRSESSDSERDDAYEITAQQLETEMSTFNLTVPEFCELQFTCALCPASFAKVEQLIAHADVHKNKELFSCNICGKRFELKFSLNRHMKRHKNITY